MKRVFFFLVVLLLVGTTYSVWAQPRVDRYNPYYSPYSPYFYRGGDPSTVGQPPNPPYDRDSVTSPYFTNPYNVVPRRPMYEDQDYYVNPYGIIPRRWYDSQLNDPGTFEKGVEDPRTIADPYKDLRPYSSGELTNPYVGITSTPQTPSKTVVTQQLTPPELKSDE